MEKTLMWEIGNMIAKRLASLKSYTDSCIEGLTIAANQITSGKISQQVLPDATSSQKGITKLQDTVTQSNSNAVTPNAVLQSIEALRTETEAKIENAVKSITGIKMPPHTILGNMSDTDSPSQNLSALQVRELLGLTEAAKFVQGDKYRLDILVDLSQKNPDFLIPEGVKSATDEGRLGQMYISDDYLFVCVKAGVQGEAKWKKTLLTQIN